MTPANIKAGFKRTRIWPPDIEIRPCRKHTLHTLRESELCDQSKSSKNNPSVSLILIFLTRGALTSQLQKGDKAPPKGTRLEVGTQLKVPFACFPDFDQLKKDEKYWAVSDVLDKIAKTRGKYNCIV